MAIMTIYVGDLSIDVSEEELRREFAAFGEVTSVVMINKDYTGSYRHSGYAFVEMPSQSEGQKAITSLNGKTLQHRSISVIHALPLSRNKVGAFHLKKRGRPCSTERIATNSVGSPILF